MIILIFLIISSVVDYISNIFNEKIIIFIDNYDDTLAQNLIGQNYIETFIKKSLFKKINLYMCFWYIFQWNDI